MPAEAGLKPALHSLGILMHLMKWLTHFENSDGLETPSYAESIAYFKKLENRSNGLAKLSSFGRTPQGREMMHLVVGKAQSPRQARQRNKAVVLIQNVIHGGEMEGKDAWMILLREILITKELIHLLDHLVLVVVPVFNVDGHERRGANNRPNQLGPLNPGWRTTAQNLDLNRDYMKADAPEMQSLLKLFHKWLPDFIIDNHTTNGADFQYRILYCAETHQNIHPVLAEWGQLELLPAVTHQLELLGIDTAPYNEGNDLKEGIINGPAPPRLSTGYSAAQNRFCMLVEAHSLKPYADRVYSTKAMNEAVLEYLNDDFEELIVRNKIADEDTVREYSFERKSFPINVVLKKESRPFLFKGVKSYEEMSSITGEKVTRYSGEPEDFEVPFFSQGEIQESVIAPTAYWVPAEYMHIVEHLLLHGIDVLQLNRPSEVLAERYCFKEISFSAWPYESHVRVNFQIEKYQERLMLMPGSFLVPTAQRSIRALLHLLEPSGPDSLVRWGFFHSIFERKEYAEPYVMEPIAQEMLKKDRALREEFQRKLGDEKFRNNASERLDFFYQRSVYFDRRERVYPVARLGEIPHESI
jgi:hypothetical protein